MLRVSRVPPGDPTIEQYVGQNRFECLTCPYHFVINKRYYERKYLKKKEVEDILGGKGAWDNVDKTEGASAQPSDTRTKADRSSAMSQRKVPQRPGLLVPAADPQCRRAHDGLLQVHKVRKRVARVAAPRRVHCENTRTWEHGVWEQKMLFIGNTLVLFYIITYRAFTSALIMHYSQYHLLAITIQYLTSTLCRSTYSLL